MTLAVEQYAEFAVAADALWNVVRTPRRLPEWTRGRAVDPPEEWEVGQRVRITERETVEWQVLSAEPRVVEVRGTTPCGDLGIGVRVVAGAGSAPTRVVFVARLDPTSTLRARLRDLPAIRRRFDRWAHGLRRVTSG